MSEERYPKPVNQEYQSIGGSQYPSPTAGEPESSHRTPTESRGHSSLEKGGTYSPTTAKVEGSGGTYSPASASLRQPADQRAGPSLTVMVGLAAVVFVAMMVVIFLFAGNPNGIGSIANLILV